jgi:small-conductance mechanosensitive channel
MTLTSLHIDGVIGVFFDKLAKVLLIIMIARIFCKIIYSLEKYINNKYVSETENYAASRKLQTQISILGRLAIFLIAIVSLSAMIMVFDSLRNIGTSLLTTAGILSAIGAFASQQSLGRVFAGLQLAFTQPIRIGDTIVIDNEFGQVEEITLSFITVKLWDLRRLIVPTDHFSQKGVLNLTLHSAELLGTVFLYADYTLPVDQIRKKFIEFVSLSPLWNEKVAELEVTDIKEHSIEIRCLLSANNASNLWKLRCQIRESLIRYIVDNHYDALTKSRTISLAKTA